MEILETNVNQLEYITVLGGVLVEKIRSLLVNHARDFICTSLEKIFCDKNPHQMKYCKTPGCNARTRSFCFYNVGEWLCVECNANHRVSVANACSAT